MINADPHETLLIKFVLTVRISYSEPVSFCPLLTLPGRLMTHMVVPCCVQHAAFVAICTFLTVPELTVRFRAMEHRTLHSINVSVTSAGVLLLDWGVLGSGSLF